jgi:hypothetical protein
MGCHAERSRQLLDRKRILDVHLQNHRLGNVLANEVGAIPESLETVQVHLADFLLPTACAVGARTKDALGSLLKCFTFTLAELADGAQVPAALLGLNRTPLGTFIPFPFPVEPASLPQLFQALRA